MTRNIARTSRRRRPQRRNDAMAVQQRQQTRDLDQIKENTQGMTRALTAQIPDIPWPHFSSKGKVHTFSREYVYGTITASTTVDQAGAINFTLSGFPSSSEFTSLFDVYRIMETQVSFVSLTTGPYISPLTTVIDYDDANAVASLNELLEYETQVTSSPGANQIRVLKPRASQAVYSGAFTSFATTPQDLWFDCASNTVQFYGVKYYLPALTGGTASAVYSIRVRSLLQFKSVR